MEIDKKTKQYMTHKRTKSSALSKQETTRQQGTEIQYGRDKQETQITRRIHKRSTALEQSVRKLLEGLNIFEGTNLTLSSDVDQNT